MEKREPVFGQRDEFPLEPQNAESDIARGEVVNSRGSSGGGGKTDQGAGFWKMLVLALVLGLLAVGWFAWNQSRQQAELLAAFEDLSSKITSTDESLSQSGAALSIRLKEQSDELEKHWSEIKKLWGVANDRNRKAIKEQKTALTEQAKALKKAKAAMNTLSSKVAKVQGQVQGQAQELKSSDLVVSAEFEDLRSELKALSSSVSRSEKQVNTLRDEMANSLSDREKSMSAMDTFRRQTNQELQALQEQLARP